MKRRPFIDKKSIWVGAKIKEPCCAHAMMGATVRGYSFIELHGALYALCYRCTQVLCGVAHPVMDEVYPTPSAINCCGKLPPGGKRMPQDIVISYEVKIMEVVPGKQEVNY